MLREFQLRKYKELFQANINMIKLVIEGCDEIGKVVKNERFKKYYEKRGTSKLEGGYYIYLGKE